MYGRISVAPRAQFRPMAIGRAWRTECQNAVTVWPESLQEAFVEKQILLVDRRAAALTSTSIVGGLQASCCRDRKQRASTCSVVGIPIDE
jgi:hypothetical protein